MILLFDAIVHKIMQLLQDLSRRMWVGVEDPLFHKQDESTLRNFKRKNILFFEVLFQCPIQCYSILHAATLYAKQESTDSMPCRRTFLHQHSRRQGFRKVESFFKGTPHGNVSICPSRNIQSVEQQVSFIFGSPLQSRGRFPKPECCIIVVCLVLF